MLTLKQVVESPFTGVAGAKSRISSVWATATAWFSGILGLPNNGIRSVNRDAVAPVIPAVMSPTPLTVVGMGFCGGTGIESAGEDLGCGTTSSTDEMDTVGLRTPR